MYYLTATPTENGNYGNPQSNGRDDMYALPDELLNSYLDTMGFAKLFVDDEGTIFEVALNEEAYQKYQDEHPPQPEPEPEPTDGEVLNALLGMEV